jgi:hypothetical protein
MRARRNGALAMTRCTDTVVKFPIGRVVREHRIRGTQHGSPELDAIEQAAISVRRAIKTLLRQEATLNLRAAVARKKVTPEQRAAACAENMRRLYARDDENCAAEAPALDVEAVRLLRGALAKLEAQAGDNDDGGSAA